jgi:hypothetical protein
MWDLARRTNPPRFTPGVYRYRSIDEMNQADVARLEAHVAETKPIAYDPGRSGSPSAARRPNG